MTHHVCAGYLDETDAAHSWLSKAVRTILGIATLDALELAKHTLAEATPAEQPTTSMLSTGGNVNNHTGTAAAGAISSESAGSSSSSNGGSGSNSGSGVQYAMEEGTSGPSMGVSVGSGGGSASRMSAFGGISSGAVHPFLETVAAASGGGSVGRADKAAAEVAPIEQVRKGQAAVVLLHPLQQTISNSAAMLQIGSRDLVNHPNVCCRVTQALNVGPSAPML